ncbi:hypothetical protein NEFER03_1141 [Nematocida sp. LUAm3]|nr:hypothetical protein NEFER03_1141 [Nematocida sp. LUAm3]KAI5176323.1 hypothetical protein NEFER02_2111 [Nematocida sp. LUAm2]KAI5178246.1 hypothetical protein NEFER01_1413 [Nematocida sp. LUAm1]
MEGVLRCNKNKKSVLMFLLFIFGGISTSTIIINKPQRAQQPLLSQPTTSADNSFVNIELDRLERESTAIDVDLPNTSGSNINKKEDNKTPNRVPFFADKEKRNQLILYCIMVSIPLFIVTGGVVWSVKYQEFPSNSSKTPTINDIKDITSSVADIVSNAHEIIEKSMETTSGIFSYTPASGSHTIDKNIDTYTAVWEEASNIISSTISTTMHIAANDTIVGNLTKPDSNLQLLPNAIPAIGNNTNAFKVLATESNITDAASIATATESSTFKASLKASPNPNL